MPLCLGLLLLLLVTPLAARHEGLLAKTSFFQVNRDFVYFYGMGRLLNTRPASDLYDLSWQDKINREVYALNPGEHYTPNPYPPFIGLLFRLVALLPYPVAYLVWTGLTFLLYFAGLTVLTGAVFDNPNQRRPLIFCFALCFQPFLWIVLGGQIAILGLFGMAVAVASDLRGRTTLSGLALALCLYKPTLLVLVLPMLLVTRRYRTLNGFAVGTGVLCGLVTVVEGPGVWAGYIPMLLNFGSTAVSAGGAGYRRLEIYMDLPAFASLLHVPPSWTGAALLTFSAGGAATLLVHAWWRHRAADPKVRMMLWVTTLTWTLILNAYVPVYDCLLAVIGMIATYAVLEGFRDSVLMGRFLAASALTVVASWFTIDVAQSSGIQSLTVMLAFLGMVQLSALHRMELRNRSEVSKS